ncbi:unnamed protein product [Umbelopsis sp. WA50703]
MAALGIVVTTLLRIDLYRRGSIKAKDDGTFMLLAIAWIEQYYIPDPNEKITIDHGLAPTCSRRLLSRSNCLAPTWVQYNTVTRNYQSSMQVKALEVHPHRYPNTSTQLLLSCVSCVSVHDVDYNRLVISNVSFISSLAQVPQWWTSYSDLLQRLHQNITANQLINYEILRYQQKELLQKQQQDQDFAERLQKVQAALEKSLKENNSQNIELAHTQMQVQSLALTIAQLTDDYGNLAEQLVDTALEQVVKAMDTKKPAVDQAST